MSFFTNRRIQNICFNAAWPLLLAGCGLDHDPGPRAATGAATVEMSRPAEMRLTNLDLQTVALPDPAMVQVYDIGAGPGGEAQNVAADAPEAASSFQIPPDGDTRRVPIHRYRTLRGEDARRFAELWRQVDFVDGPGLMCHYPAYAFRCFDAAGRVTFATSVCWGCGNFFLRAGDGSFHSYGLIGGAPGSQAMLDYCKQLMADPAAHAPGEAGATGIITGKMTPYVPDALDAFKTKPGDVTDADLAALHGFSRLQSLDIFSPKITDAGLATLSTLTGLRSLTLGTPTATAAGLAHLGALHELTDLSFYNTPIDDRVLETISNLTQLRGLGLGGDDNGRSCSRGVTDAGLARLARLTALRDLDLHFIPITDDGLAHLAGLQQLELLSVDGTELTGAGFKHLTGLPHLTEVQADHAGITDDGLAGIAQLPKLEILYLDSDAHLTDAGMSHFAHCPKLYRLTLRNDAITNAGLARLAAAPSLTHLDLTGTHLTDAAVPIFKTMPKLDTVWLSDTGISAEAIAALNAARHKATFQP